MDTVWAGFAMTSSLLLYSFLLFILKEMKAESFLWAPASIGALGIVPSVPNREVSSALCPKRAQGTPGLGGSESRPFSATWELFRVTEGGAGVP